MNKREILAICLMTIGYTIFIIHDWWLGPALFCFYSSHLIIKYNKEERGKRKWK